MVFCSFGLLKRALGIRYLRTLNEIWRTVQEEWDKIDMPVVRKKVYFHGKFRLEVLSRSMAIKFPSKIRHLYIKRNHKIVSIKSE